MELLDKLAILADAAKYDAACTSSGVRRGSRPGMIGNTTSSVAGCCHSFSADGPLSRHTASRLYAPGAGGTDH